MKEAHLIANGLSAGLYKPAPKKDLIITCNLPPFAVDNAYATCIVDYKMMFAMAEGSVVVPGEWVLGFRPKDFISRNPDFQMRHAYQIKEFYTVLPEYVKNYTDLTCGHMACHYICNVHQPDILNMYGFDSLFDFDLRSSTDFFLSSDRGTVNTHRLIGTWRNIWPDMWKEFSDITFRLHTKHPSIKIPKPDNVEIVLHK